MKNNHTKLIWIFSMLYFFMSFKLIARNNFNFSQASSVGTYAGERVLANDMDDDGISDVVLYNPGTGQVIIRKNIGSYNPANTIAQNSVAFGTTIIVLLHNASFNTESSQFRL